MHQFATGTSGSDLLDGGPPLSPETIGRAPSNFDAPVPVIPLEELVRLKAQALPAPTVLPTQETTSTPTIPVLMPVPVVATERRRVVVRLVGGDEIELGAWDGQTQAVDQARALVSELSTAEQCGRWPEVAGRHLRPAAIVSVDVLLAD